MSRYFKYKTAEDLLLDAEARGLRDVVQLSKDLSPLLQTIEIGGRLVGNRLAVQPMEGCDGTSEGVPGDLTFRRYQRFGAGGAKLIWAEAAAIVPEARANPRQLVIDEARLPGLRDLLNHCRNAHAAAFRRSDDLLIGLQLTHSGRYSYQRPLIVQHDPLLDPRTVVDKATGATVSPSYPLLTDDQLQRLQDRYVEAAGLAQRAGFDFIDIKQCHRYLLNELLAAKTRPGRFGGSFENRTRFIRELVERIRDRYPDLIVATRLNVFDGLPYTAGPLDSRGVPEPFDFPVRSTWGTRADDPQTPDLSEPIALIARLRQQGLTLVNISMGNPYAGPHLLRPFEYAPVDGYQTPEHPLEGVARHFRATAEIQKAFPDLAVVGSGYSWLQTWLPQAGAANVEAGRVSFVGYGRASLSNPDLARSVLEGRPLDPKRTCRTFSYCTALMRSKHNELGQFAAGCPPFDKAVYGPIWDEAKVLHTSE